MLVFIEVFARFVFGIANAGRSGLSGQANTA